MKRTLVVLLFFCGPISLFGCNFTTTQSPTPPVVSHNAAAPTPKPSKTPTLPFHKLHPRFRFDVRRVGFSRYTNEKTKQQRVVFGMEIGYKGPRPKWWGDRPQISTLTLITSAGQRFEADEPRGGEDYFSSAKDQCVLDTVAEVPGLKQTDRVPKVEVVFEVYGGLVKIVADIPRGSQVY